MSDDAKKEAARLKSALTRRVKKLIAQTLEPQGFKKETKTPLWICEGETLARCCVFRSRLREFDVCCYFSFRFHFDFLRNPPSEIGDRAQWEEVCNILNGAIHNDIWKSRPFPQTEEELETTVTEVETYFNDVVLPYCERWRDSSVVAREYDAGNITQKQAFGASETWQFLRLGWLRFEAERYAEAAACFEEAANAGASWLAKLTARGLVNEEEQAFWTSFNDIARYAAEEARRRQKSS